MSLVLSDVTVVELGEGAALAYCGKLLADSGARVIKVEPPQGDALRRAGPRGLVDDLERSATFLHLNTNKESTVFDIADESDRGSLAALVRRADVLIESLPPGRLAELGLSYEAMSADRPELVVISLTPYGQHGPYRDYAATEMTLFASGGAMYREGLPDREPLRYAGQVPRTFPGLVAAGMVAAALLRRRDTGAGDWIDLAEVDCWASHPNQISRRLVYSFSGHAEPREETKASATPAAAGFGRGTYRCLDGYATFLPLGDRHWPRLVEFVGRPELAEDPRFATREARREHRADWEELYEAFLRELPLSEVFARAQEAGIPAAPLNDAARVLADPHLAERGFFHEIEHPVAGKLRHPGPPANAGADYWRLDRAAPLLGEHTRAVLRELQQDAAGPAMPDRDERAPSDNGRWVAGRLSRSRLPLAGVRAVEIAEIWAGPFLGVLLGDLGAEVIKVEAIQRSARGAVRPLAGTPGYPNGEPDPDPWNRTAAFLAVNRNKQGLTLDLHAERGQELLDDLLGTADVVFTNLSLDAQQSLNLLPERLHRANPKLVVALLTGFGLTGPYRYYRSMGMTLDAASGHSVLRGYPDLDLSTITPVHHPDGIGGALGLLMVCLALERRAQTGEGQVIDLAQLEAAVHHVGDYVLDWQLSGKEPARLGNRHAWMAPHGCFIAREPDTWVAVAVDSDARFQSLCTALGRPDLAADDRYTTVQGRLAHVETLNAAVATWVAQRDRFEAEEQLQAHGVPAAAVLRPDVDHVRNTHVLDRGVIAEADFHGYGTFLYPRAPWNFQRTDPLPWEPAPRLGEHNREILGDLLGLDESALRELEERQVIGTRPLETADQPVPVRRRAS